MNFAACPGIGGIGNDFRERYELRFARGSLPMLQDALAPAVKPFLTSPKKKKTRPKPSRRSAEKQSKPVVPLLTTMSSKRAPAYEAILRAIQKGLGSSSKMVNGRLHNE